MEKWLSAIAAVVGRSTRHGGCAVKGRVGSAGSESRGVSFSLMRGWLRADALFLQNHACARDRVQTRGQVHAMEGLAVIPATDSAAACQRRAAHAATAGDGRSPRPVQPRRGWALMRQGDGKTGWEEGGRRRGGICWCRGSRGAADDDGGRETGDDEHAQQAACAARASGARECRAR